MAVGGVLLVFMSRGTEDDKQSNPEPPAQTTTAPEPQPEEPEEPALVLPESTCPPELGSNCVVASGRVVFVEEVDPDGDGDAHFVTASGSSITGPGVTIFDVRTDLRPDPLPGIGDLVGGAGPVYPGSRGQKQIEVVEFHVAKP